MSISLHELKWLRADPRRAIRRDIIVCLVCGAPFRQLTNSHLRGHGTTGPDYKRRFGYNARRPLMCTALRHEYARRALDTGLAGKIRQRPIITNPELRRRGGRRSMTLEERLNRSRVVRRDVLNDGNDSYLGSEPP